MEFLSMLKNIPVSIAQSIMQNPVGFVTDELLGVDDFRRAAKYGAEGDMLRALKSLGAGTFEAGSTLLPAGALIKGAKGGKTIAQSIKSPARAQLIESIPGLARQGALTRGGKNALRGLRAGEYGQWADFANAAGAMAGVPGPSVGSRAMIDAEIAREMQRQVAQQRFSQIMQQLSGGGGYAV